MEAPYSPRRGLDSMKRHQDLYKKTPDWKRKYKDRCRDRLKCGRTRLLEQFRGIQIVDQVMKETVRLYCYNYKIIIEILGIRKWDFISTRGRLFDGTV